MSDSREAFEATLRRIFGLGETHWRQSDSESYRQNRLADETWDKYQALFAETAAAWSARDSEVERLREALRQCFDFPADVFDIPDNEPFTMTVTGRHLRMVRAALSSQDKESA